MPVITPTTQWLAGNCLIFKIPLNLFVVVCQRTNVSTFPDFRSGQILWIRGLTRLQTQVGADM